MIINLTQHLNKSIDVWRFCLWRAFDRNMYIKKGITIISPGGIQIDFFLYWCVNLISIFNVEKNHERWKHNERVSLNIVNKSIFDKATFLSIS